MIAANLVLALLAIAAVAAVAMIGFRVGHEPVRVVREQLPHEEYEREAA